MSTDPTKLGGEPATDMERRYVEVLAKLPDWKCGRLDINTYLPEAVRVGRVESDIVRYIYFEDGQEVVVIGKRADEMAFAASQYRNLLRALAQEAERG